MRAPGSDPAAPGAAGCLDEDALGQLVEGRLVGAARAAAEQHLDGCPACRRLVALAGPADDGRDELSGAPDDAVAATLDARAAPPAPGPLDDGRPRYQLGPRLVTTAAGAIHGAHDRRLGCDVAILLAEPGPGVLAGLREQARVQARIDHPGVCPIREVGEADGRAYLVMPVSGVDALAPAARDMSLEEKVRVLRDVAIAAHAAHAAGCSHGALTAASVLIERGDDGAPAPRVLGFHLAAPVDRRADVRGLGALLYELCAGRPPSARSGAPAGRPPLALRVVSPRVPADLDAVAMRCLRPAAGDRYSTALDVADELDRYLDGEPVRARRGAPLGRLWAWGRRQRALVAAAALVGVAALIAGLLAERAARAERRAVVDRALAAGAAAGDAATDLAAAARTQRDDALAMFRADRGAEAEAAWVGASGARERSALAYARAERAFEAALLWDPARADVRAALADILLAQAVIADEGRDGARRDALLARLAVYDRDGRRRRAFAAPPVVELVTRPAGARIEVRRYVADPRGLLAEQVIGPRGPTPVVIRDLPPGSYLLIIEAAGRAPVRLPVLLRPRAPVAIDLDLPRVGAVPDGFVYVPPGRGFVGSDREGLRAITDALPLHEVDTAGYLIARTETTVADWIAFLDALPADQRAARRPRARHFGAAVELIAGPAGWRYRVEHASGWQAEVGAGEPLVHPGRRARAAQDWRRLPVTGVSLDDALAYVAWLDASGRRPGARLCTEVELARAARGADDRALPRGASLDPDDANLLPTHGVAGVGLDEVGSHPGGKSPFGVDDLVGNVGELVAPAPGSPRAYTAGAEDFVELAGAGIGRRAVMPRTFRTPTSGLRVCAPPRGLW